MFKLLKKIIAPVFLVFALALTIVPADLQAYKTSEKAAKMKREKKTKKSRRKTKKKKAKKKTKKKKAKKKKKIRKKKTDKKRKGPQPKRL